MSGAREDGFLGRWSARKRGQGTEEPQLAEPAEALVEEAAPEKTDAEILAELELPDPDELQRGDDFSRFMAEAVPARIRNRALRKLWISDPVLANLDELLDYGDDFTDAATVVENLQTAYQAGKGFLKDVLEEGEDAPVAAAEEDAEAPEVFPPDEKPAQDPVALAEIPAEPSPVTVSAAAAPPESDPIPVPRRMRFTVGQG